LLVHRASTNSQRREIRRWQRGHCLAKPAGDVEGSRILVGLHPDQSHKAEVFISRKGLQQSGNIDTGIEFIDRLDVDIDVCTQYSARGAVDGNAVDARERIRRDHRSPPSDHIAIIAIV
jgi:hypothetical protein